MKKCCGCGNDMTTADDPPFSGTPDKIPPSETYPGLSICMNCLEPFVSWLVSEWVKAGAPGAKRP